MPKTSTGSIASLNTLSAPGKFVRPLSISDRVPHRTWPPPVTYLPEDANSIDEDLSVSLDTSQFDGSFCRYPCRFLLPLRIGEQESKARQHFLQLATLARELNRTLVLPNVGKSRLGVCAKWPFETYYDVHALATSMDSVATIRLADFWNWMERRPTDLTNRLVLMGVKGKGDRHVDDRRNDFTVTETEIDQKLLSCLRTKLPRLRLSSPSGLLVSFNPGRPKNIHTPSQLVQLLSQSLDRDTPNDKILSDVTDTGNFASADVIIVDYDLRYAIFNEPLVSLHYAPSLYDLADRLAANVRPFLAVHWRMEGVPVQNLAWCAASLINVLNRVLQEGQNIRNVWFATDYPFLLDDSTGNESNDSGPHRYGGTKSSTFKTLTPEHGDAVKLVREAFRSGRELDAYRLTDLSEQLRHYPNIMAELDIGDELLEDSGIYGILDKLSIVQSQIFVSGSEECSKTSCFSKQVIDGRQEVYSANTEKADIRNVVEYFGE